MLRSWLVKRRLRALAVERCHPSDGTSASDNYSPVPQEFAAAVVALVEGLVPVVRFPILPEDNLWQLYDIDQGSLESESEDFILRIAPGAPSLAEASVTHPIETVRDLVSLLYSHAEPFLEAPPNNSL